MTGGKGWILIVSDNWGEKKTMEITTSKTDCCLYFLGVLPLSVLYPYYPFRDFTVITLSGASPLFTALRG